jgi:hypothetical protein
MNASFQTDQAMGWTIEKSWFDSRLGQETSLLCEAPEMPARAVGSFHGAEGPGGGGEPDRCIVLGLGADNVRGCN